MNNKVKKEEIMSYKSGNICTFYQNGFGSCFCNGSRCDSPFSEEGCRIQCKEIFKEDYDSLKGRRYKPRGKQELLTKTDIYKRIGIKKGDLVADYFIPYSEMEILIDQHSAIQSGFDIVKQKFANYYNNGRCPQVHYRIYQNMKLTDNVLGIYIIGIIPMN